MALAGRLYNGCMFGEGSMRFWGCALGLALAAGAQTPVQPAAGQWQPMFDGKTLDGWKETPFAARGKVSLQDGDIVLGTGAMTGVNYTKPFPKTNYEVRYRAARIDGWDFFGALTFPVGDAYLTFINGGWSGSVVGLSSLDDQDAAENDTSTTMNFEKGRWYLFRIRVTDDAVRVWIDDEKVIDVALAGRTLSLRPGDIERSAPFGFASYSTTGALRDIEYRLLPADGADAAQ